MKTLTLLAMTSAALTVAAQTPGTTHQTAVHHPVATHAAAPVGGCVTTPAISSKIPALPAAATCTKALYTISRTPETHLDYVSPLVSPELREALDIKKETFTLLYSDVKTGTGELVRPGTFLTVKYTGWLTDGTKFDSSEDHDGAEPLSFQHGQHKVIAGWDTGFEGMRVGAKRRLYIPYQLAYGEPGRGPIPARAMLVFDIELVAQGDTAPAPPAPKPVPAPAADPAKPTTPPPANAAPKQ